MLKFCNYCAATLDEQGFCTNPKCADYKRKLIVEAEKKAIAEKAKSTANPNNDKG